jgi:serpin B
MRSQKGNLVASPFSIATALSMAWMGARGETAAQMKKVLHLEGDRTLDVVGWLSASYGAPGAVVTVRVANRLFGDQAYAFEPPFLSRVKTAFGAPLEPVDFQNAPADARDRINAWVAGETQGRITGVVPPGGVDVKTRLVLTNAIYFLGDWASPFKTELTRPAPFSLSRSEKKDVPTMHQEHVLRYAATAKVKVVELPYRDGALAMTFVLPDAVDGLAAMEARLTPAALDGWIAAAQPTYVSLWLPKLEIAPAAPLSLSDTLSAMGMPLAFDRFKADFTGMTSSPRPEDQLFLSKVFHKAFVRVDEKGTEAAAASAAVMTRKISARVGPTTELKLDHPFLYFLRDTRTGLILFMGRVADPSSK